MTRQRKYFNTKPFLQNGFTTSFYLLKCYKFGSSLCLSVIIKPTWLKISGRVYLLKSKFWALPVTLEEPISLYKIRVLQRTSRIFSNENVRLRMRRSRKELSRSTAYERLPAVLCRTLYVNISILCISF